MPHHCFLALLVFSAALLPAVASPAPGHEDAWFKELEELYDRLQHSVGFCLGSNQRKLLRLMQLSFPWPLPVSPPDTAHSDGVCSNRTRLVPFLCGKAELELYYRFFLSTSDPEKVPSTSRCPAGGASHACSPGFFDSNNSWPAWDSGQRSPAHPHPCCPGFFCPRNLACMVPCPLGAYCPPAQAALPPKAYRPKEPSANASMWCAPYAYKQRQPLGCGGADRWTVIPSKAFPAAAWKLGSGSIYCGKSWYCPNTTSRQPCPARRFCREGSVEPERCPPGALCPAGTDVPSNNFGGALADAALLLVLALAWWISAHYRAVMRRVGLRERLRVRWGRKCSISVVPANEDVTVSAGYEQLPEQGPSSASGAARSDSNGGGGGVDGVLPAQRQPLEVEFQRLSLRLRANGRVVLADVSGKLRSGRLTCIMGPSGAGKSSLLNALAGRAPYGRVSGRVLVNGRPERLERFKRVLGFVPQDDNLLHPTLTVEENLAFAARYRLPAGFTATERQRQVDSTLCALGLESVRQERVGDEATRGISGGQRKRVNIGLELVAVPLLLLLDEPTSGLDASSAKALAATLLQVAHRGGVTTAAVIHAPRHEAFCLFDDVIFLGKGGRTAYYGPVQEAEGYFEGLGYELPLHTNPADALLDILTGEVCRSGEDHAKSGSECGPELLFAAWEQRMRSTGASNTDADSTIQGESSSSSLVSILGDSAPASLLDGDSAGGRSGPAARSVQERGSSELLLGDSQLEARSIMARVNEAAVLAAVGAAGALGRVGKVLARLEHAATGGRLLCRRRRRLHMSSAQALGSSGADLEAARAEEAAARALRQRATPGFFPQFWWCLRRAALKRSREPLQAVTDLAIIAAAGMTLGLLSDRGRATILSFASQASYSVIALGLIAIVGAVPTFSTDVLAFRREAASGLNRLSYFAALDVFDLAGALVRSAVYLATWSSFASPRAVMWQQYVVIAAAYYACCGAAYLLAMLLDCGSAQLAAAVLTLISTLVARQTAAGGALAFIQHLSFARWALEGLVIAESNRLVGVWLLARCATLAELHYDVRRLGVCIAALGGLGLAARCAALAVLMSRHA